jgi:hypothetical protein
MMTAATEDWSPVQDEAIFTAEARNRKLSAALSGCHWSFTVGFILF